MSTLRVLSTAVIALVLAVVGSASTAHATFPNQNGLIAFALGPQSTAQIYTVSPNGTGLHQITHVDGAAVFPNWSPDGRQIVFEYDLPNGAGCHVELMAAHGTGIVDLTTAANAPGWPGCENAPAFAPDGSRIIFDRYDPTTNLESLWSMNPKGGDRQQIPVCCAGPKVSPDGTMLSFVEYDAVGQGALFTSRLDGSNSHQLTPFAFDIQNKQDWAPDGQHLVFSDDSDQAHPGVSPNILTIRPDGTQLHYVTHYTSGGQVNAGGGTYSPDGQWIAFRFTENGQYWLYKMHPDGSDMQPILPLSSVRPFNTDWGPALAP